MNHHSHGILQDHRTALFWAAMKGQDDVVKVLLQRGADTNIKNKVSHASGSDSNFFFSLFSIPCWFPGFSISF